MCNKQDNNFGDIESHGYLNPPDNDGLRECEYDQMDCPHYLHDRCGVDECVYGEGMENGKM